jgi:hypothetical protein
LPLSDLAFVLVIGALEFGIYLVLGAWDLEFNSSRLPYPVNRDLLH